MKAHGLDVDVFARELQRIRPRAKMMDEALRDADHIVSEMDKLVKPEVIPFNAFSSPSFGNDCRGV